MIYPNPAENGIFTIEMENFSGATKIRMFDMSGKVVYQTLSIDQQFINLNLDVPKGIYIVKAVNNQISVAKRVTVN